MQRSREGGGGGTEKERGCREVEREGEEAQRSREGGEGDTEE